tara:strand:+ start:1027 stop:1335 length:309 start_codon:yes stop_codon:yes gene_type:complete
MNQTPDFLVKALQALVPKAQFISYGGKLELLDWKDERPKPSDKEITDKVAELQTEYEKQAYARSRAESYDPIPEQLDQIYHDMDGWKKRIKSVKDKYPKQSE